MDPKQQQTSADYTNQRLNRAEAQLNSAIADAAHQGILGSDDAVRLMSFSSTAPRDPLDRELITEQVERLASAMSYLNQLEANGQLEPGWTRTLLLHEPELICTLTEACQRDFSLIEYRLEEGVKAGVITESQRAAVLANPYLNQQAVEALDVFSKIR